MLNHGHLPWEREQSYTTRFDTQMYVFILPPYRPNHNRIPPVTCDNVLSQTGATRCPPPSPRTVDISAA